MLGIPDQAEARADFTPTPPVPDQPVPERLADLTRHVDYIRLIRCRRHAARHGPHFPMPDDLVDNYVVASPDVGAQQLSVYHHGVEVTTFPYPLTERCPVTSTKPAKTWSGHHLQELPGKRCAVIYQLAWPSASPRHVKRSRPLWGWKAVSRRLDQVQLTEAKAALAGEDFDTQKEGEDYVILKRSGSKRAVTGRKAPLDVRLVAQPGGGVDMHVAYDKFALFDTGDLRREADRLQGTITRKP
jgi:hypothetical protein